MRDFSESYKLLAKEFHELQSELHDLWIGPTRWPVNSDVQLREEI